MRIKFALALIACLLLFSLSFAQKQEGYGVYQYIVEEASGTLEDLSQAIENSARENGWQVLARIDAGVPEGCPYRARVLVLYHPDYARQVMEANRITGPFAVVDRINIFEDERGTHVSVVNPHSINRTILMDDQAYEEMTAAHLNALRSMVTSVVQGRVSSREYGQFRKKGYIGKTMGVMAGGKFADKLIVVKRVASDDWQSVAASVKQGLEQKSKKWGMHLVYEVALPEYQTVIFGTTGTPMDSKSFAIVRAGGDKSRKDFKCPGLAHAAAYPIEVVVSGEEDGVAIRLVEEMFRMKMYFEDAGKWAFMKNMRMPGSIQKELEQQIERGLTRLTAK